MLRHCWILLFLLPQFAFCQKPGRVQLIPEPVSVVAQNGFYTLDEAAQIQYPNGESEFQLAAEYLAAVLRPSTAFALPMTPYKGKAASGNAIVFQKDEKSVTHPEGYRMDLDKNRVVIRARTGAGAFYAVQSLLQLFPAAVWASTPQKSVDWTAQACTVEDYPRFGYRGLHLDVGRHWFPVSFIKRYIDLLAMHKMNRFHWHLTEDQGWRIEIKKYPRLQSVAACRAQTLQGHYSDRPETYDGLKYCHYYTQEEVKEVVEYARKRFVTIVPEIEMPGHALAALSAYPELGCEGAGYEAATKWGVFDDVFCAGNDKVFAFLEDVLAEVCPLFPGAYLHVGGDECPKTRWAECPRCQKRMQQEGLKDEHELQSYFIRRAEKILAQHGKKLIGWDEILEGGIAPEATIMSWRGIEGGIAAAKAGHDAIMTPGSHCYFDYYQSDPATEPLAIGGYLPLERVYGYEPVPEELNETEAKHILGAQGNVWTEYIQSPDKVEYMTYPRAAALAEVVWSPKEKRNWDDFRLRLRKHFLLLDARKVNYAKSYFDISAAFTEGKVQLKCADPGVQIRYTTDGSEPGAGAQVFTAPFAITQNTNVKAVAWQQDKALGKVLSVQYLLHKASGKPYTLSKNPEKYTGGETYALTNGVTGSMRTYNAWVGLVNRDLDPVIDLGAAMPVQRVTTQYMNNKQAWIHPPKAIEVWVSENGTDFRSVGKKRIDPEEKMNSGVERVTISFQRVQARYVKLVATTAGVIPEGNPGAGEGAWLFLDEVMVD